MPSLSLHIFTFHKRTAIIQNPSRSSGRPTKAWKLPLREKMQRGRVFMSLNPWSTFEHRTVNEPLVMFKLLMNVIKKVLSCSKVQGPAKATSIHSLMIKLCGCCLLFSRFSTSLVCTLKSRVTLKQQCLRCTDVIL